jgi:biotin carboxyl carrier protein
VVSPSTTRRLLDGVAELPLERTLAGAVDRLAALAAEVTGADRARCWLYDSERGLLTSGLSGSAPRAATAGLIAWVARTGLGVRLASVGADARYIRELDDPTGVGDERVLVEPIRFAGGQVLAVVMVLRSSARSGFDEGEVSALGTLATQAAPALALLTRAPTPTREDDGAARASQEDTPSATARRSESHLLRLSPAWTGRTFWALMAALAAGLVLAVLGRVHEDTYGAALLRAEGRLTLRAAFDGTVVSVAVRPGESVAAGQLLVQLDDTLQVAELQRATRELEQLLARSLKDPSDRQARESLTSLRAEQAFAMRRREERAVRAPRAGVVGDLRVRPGQRVAPGMLLTSLEPERPEYRVLALLPGASRPYLRPGMPLRLRLTGYERIYRDLTIESVGAEVIGPAEVRRFLGPEIADAVVISGPVVVVAAHLPSGTFAEGGDALAYHDGMPGMVEVRVRSEPFLVALLPALRPLFTAGESG